MNDVMMMTSDVALKVDPAYTKIGKRWLEKKNQLEFENQFRHQWYKLMTRDMGPVTRCLGPEVPPQQPFQDPLPGDKPSPYPNEQKKLNAEIVNVNYVKLQADVVSKLRRKMSERAANTNNLDGQTYGDYVRLQYACQSTFRQTDYKGGCNGGRVSQKPQIDWAVNSGLDKTVAAIKDIWDPSLHKYFSFADMIVIAQGNSIEDAQKFANAT